MVFLKFFPLPLGVIMLRFFIVLSGSLVLMLAPGGLFADSGSSNRVQKKIVSSEFAAAQVQIKSKNYQKAIVFLNKALAENDNDADIYNLLGYSFRKTGDLVKGQHYYLKALAIEPDHLGALEYQGELFLLQGNLVQAKANLNRLDGLCFWGCEEFNDLKKAIRKHEN